LNLIVKRFYTSLDFHARRFAPAGSLNSRTTRGFPIKSLTI
jgi:hypothetical protein